MDGFTEKQDKDADDDTEYISLETRDDDDDAQADADSDSSVLTAVDDESDDGMGEEVEDKPLLQSKWKEHNI
jgi:hypothetical protein